MPNAMATILYHWVHSFHLTGQVVTPHSKVMQHMHEICGPV